MEDDLSNLPDEILQHILSFLETKEAVQTSLLSHRWRHLWRSLPILTIDSDSFRYYSTFSTFLRTLLRSRAHAPLSSCYFSFDISNPIYSSIQMCLDSRDLFEPLVARLIRHVTARGVRTLALLFPRIVDSLPLLFSCPSLNHLRLSELVILPSFFGFSTLTTLRLVKCSFLIDGVDFDPFPDFVHLADLTVCDCRIPSRVKLFRISAPHLANLTISDMEHVRNLHPECEIAVSSAEIASFRFVSSHILRFSAAACLPCIETLDVDVLAVHYPLSYYEMSRLIDMLGAFGDAKTVTLSLQTLRVLALFPDALRRASPFTGIKDLKLKVPHESSPITNPAEVLAFLLNGTPAIDFKEEYLKQVPSSSMGKN